MFEIINHYFHNKLFFFDLAKNRFLNVSACVCVTLHKHVCNCALSKKKKKLQHSDSQVYPSIPTNTAATLQGWGHFNWPTSEL